MLYNFVRIKCIIILLSGWPYGVIRELVISMHLLTEWLINTQLT